VEWAAPFWNPARKFYEHSGGCPVLRAGISTDRMRISSRISLKNKKSTFSSPDRTPDRTYFESHIFTVDFNLLKSR
jgi:hypothetical protein